MPRGFLFTHRPLFAILALLIGAMIVAGGYALLTNQNGQPFSGSVEKITLGAFAGETVALVWIAEDRGYFDDVGLEVEIKEFRAGTFALDALVSGEVDVATASEFAVVKKSFAENDLNILASIATAQIRFMIGRKDRGIEVPIDIRRKRVGITRGTGGEFSLGTFLLQNGFTLDDIEVVDLKPSELVEHILRGTIDAALTWQPNVFEIASRLGANAAIFPAQYGQDMYFVLAAAGDRVALQEAAIERLLRALIKAEDFASKKPEIAQDIVARKFGYENEYIREIWNYHSFSVTLPYSLLLAMEDEANWLIESGLVGQTSVPNFLRNISADSLHAVSPGAVSVVR